MNNIIQFLIGFRLPDIGYWNFLPRHFTSLLYLGEIYRNLSEVTLKKNVECASEIQSVRSVTSIQFGLIWHEMIRYTAVRISVAVPPHIGHFLHITECRTLRHENLVTEFSYIFQFTFIITYKPLSMPQKLLQHDTMFFSPTFVPCILIKSKLFIHQRMHKWLS
jgi:hypothetical protein